MSEVEKENGFFTAILKGIILSVTISLIAILIFAGVVKVCKLNSSVVKAVNQFIKIISLFLGITYSVRGQRGFVKGGIIGGIFSLLVHLIFLIIGGEIALNTMLIDFAFCAGIGLLSGAIVINIKRESGE